MCWNDNWSLARNIHTKELLQNPVMVNRDTPPLRHSKNKK